MKFAYIQDKALEFTRDILDEFDLPSTIETSVSYIRGFESDDDFYSKSGYIVVNARFNTLLGHTVHMDIFVPLKRGVLLRPSVISIEGKKTILSKNTIRDVLANIDTTKPVLLNRYECGQAFQHVDNIQISLFDIVDEGDPEPYYERYLTDQMGVPESTTFSMGDRY